MKSKIVLATGNPHKQKMLRWIVDGYFDEVVNQDAKIEVEETADSFKGNAELKAVAASKKYKTYSIATDGGVLIPALGDDWNGVLTRRFLGKKDVTDWDRIEGLLALMKDKTGDERLIIWHEALALARDGKLLFSVEVEGDRGMLQTTYDKTQYQSGIWQCTLTCYPQFGGKNFFELTKKEKEYAEISWHRLREATRKYLNNNA